MVGPISPPALAVSMLRLTVSPKALSYIMCLASRARKSPSVSPPSSRVPILILAISCTPSAPDPLEPKPDEEMDWRSNCSSLLAIVQPALTSPTSWSLGTFTSVKKVSQKGDDPEINRMGRVSTPSLAISNRIKLMPLCLTEVSVRTRQKIQSALSA